MLVSLILFTVIVLVIAFLAQRYFRSQNRPFASTRYAYLAIAIVWLIGAFTIYRTSHP